MNIRKTIALAGLWLPMITGCSSHPSSPVGATNDDPQGVREPASLSREGDPKLDLNGDLGRSLVSALDIKLGAGEAWKFGDKEKEIAEFEVQTREVMAAQRQLVKVRDGLKLSGGHSGPARVFHQKSHGCYAGYLSVPNELEESFRGGALEPGARYPVLVRFSNGVGHERADANFDVRGIAVKIAGLRDAATGEEKITDILMTNSKIPFGRDQEEFVGFMEANIPRWYKLGDLDPKRAAKLGPWLATRGRISRALIDASWPVKTLRNAEFGSGHAYQYGRIDWNGRHVGRPVKLSLEPTCSAEEKSANAMRDPDDSDQHALRSILANKTSLVKSALFKSPNYLREDLVRHLAQGSIAYTLTATPFVDDERTPVEDNRIRWETPAVKLATLEIPPQKASAQLDEYCNRLSFSPNNFLTQHRPMSNLGRGRLFAYRASSHGRGAVQPGQLPASAAPLSRESLEGLFAQWGIPK